MENIKKAKDLMIEKKDLIDRLHNSEYEPWEEVEELERIIELTEEIFELLNY